jgi:tetratricopeptide (TPR) repeat protein
MDNALRLATAVALLTLVLSAQAFEPCGSLDNAYGPFDYTNTEHRQKWLRIVEKFHFSEHIEYLTGPNVSGHLSGNLDYTLRAFPNHHRALRSMANLSLREKTIKPRGAQYTVDCYFDRAMRFKPNDPMVHLTYSIYLHKAGKLKEALERLIKADQLKPGDANINYNLGLLYFDLKNYGDALARARQAYAKGIGLPGLKDKLSSVGHWRD